MKHAKRTLLQRGFTLVELMVSLAIGLLIILALLTLMINVNRSNNEMVKANRTIENGRFALTLLAADVSHAGFWGGYIPQFDDLTASTTVAPADYPTAIPDPCLAYASWTAQYKTNMIGIPVQAYEIPATVPSPTLSVCATKVVSPKANTDVLLVRHAEMADQKCVPGAVGCVTADQDVYFQMDRECRTAAPTTPYVLTNTSANLSLLQRATASSSCATTEKAAYRKFISDLYYVRDFAVTAGDGIPTLMRSRFGWNGTVPEHLAPEALIEGVEGFRVEFGVDALSDSGAAVNHAAGVSWANPLNKTSPTNRGDGVPEGAFVHCTTATPCTVAQMVNTVVVKVYVLIRADNITPGYTDDKTYSLGSTTLGPFNDRYKRHLFQQTIRLQNVSSRRETP